VYTDDEFRRIIATMPGVAQGTRNSYGANMKRVLKIFGGTTPLCDILLDPEGSFPRISASFAAKGSSRASFQNMIGSLMSLLRFSWMMYVQDADGKPVLGPDGRPVISSLYKRWEKVYQPLKIQVRERGMMATPTPRQVKAWLDWDAILANNKRLAAKDASGIETLLSEMYVSLLPRRLSDYHKVFLVRTEADRASKAFRQAPAVLDLTLDVPTIDVRAFKTVKTHGAWSKTLPPRLLRCLRASLAREPRAYLFVRPSDKKPFTDPNQFGKWRTRCLRRWFGKKHVSNNSLRHAYATVLRKMSAKLTPLEVEQRARDMGHSAAMSARYAFKTKTPMDN
jgi:hypothetical protein